MVFCCIAILAVAILYFCVLWIRQVCWSGQRRDPAYAAWPVPPRVLTGHGAWPVYGHTRHFQQQGGHVATLFDNDHLDNNKNTFSLFLWGQWRIAIRGPQQVEQLLSGQQLVEDWPWTPPVTLLGTSCLAPPQQQQQQRDMLREPLSHTHVVRSYARSFAQAAEQSLKTLIDDTTNKTTTSSSTPPIINPHGPPSKNEESACLMGPSNHYNTNNDCPKLSWQALRSYTLHLVEGPLFQMQRQPSALARHQPQAPKKAKPKPEHMLLWMERLKCGLDVIKMTFGPEWTYIWICNEYGRALNARRHLEQLFLAHVVTHKRHWGYATNPQWARHPNGIDFDDEVERLIGAATTNDNHTENDDNHDKSPHHDPQVERLLLGTALDKNNSSPKNDDNDNHDRSGSPNHDPQVKRLLLSTAHVNNNNENDNHDDNHDRSSPKNGDDDNHINNNENDDNHDNHERPSDDNAAPGASLDPKNANPNNNHNNNNSMEEPPAAGDGEPTTSFVVLSQSTDKPLTPADVPPSLPDDENDNHTTDDDNKPTRSKSMNHIDVRVTDAEASSSSNGMANQSKSTRTKSLSWTCEMTNGVWQEDDDVRRIADNTLTLDDKHHQNPFGKPPKKRRSRSHSHGSWFQPQMDRSTGSKSDPPGKPPRKRRLAKFSVEMTSSPHRGPAVVPPKAAPNSYDLQGTTAMITPVLDKADSWFNEHSLHMSESGETAVSSGDNTPPSSPFRLKLPPFIGISMESSASLPSGSYIITPRSENGPFPSQTTSSPAVNDRRQLLRNTKANQRNTIHESDSKQQVPSLLEQILRQRGPEEKGMTQTVLMEVCINLWMMLDVGNAWTSMALQLLARDQSSLYLVQEELDALETEYGPAGLFSKDALDRMQHLDALLYESIRLMPPFLGGLKSTTKTVVLEDAQVQVPKGSHIFFCQPTLQNFSLLDALGKKPEDLGSRYPCVELFGFLPLQGMEVPLMVLQSKVFLAVTLLKFSPTVSKHRTFIRRVKKVVNESFRIPSRRSSVDHNDTNTRQSFRITRRIDSNELSYVDTSTDSQDMPLSDDLEEGLPNNDDQMTPSAAAKLFTKIPFPEPKRVVRLVPR